MEVDKQQVNDDWGSTLPSKDITGFFLRVAIN
jgi:hypothetical protein